MIKLGDMDITSP